MNRLALVICLVVLACLVPLSSKRPDAIQHVLGLPGGVDSAPKALLGIGVAAAVVAGLAYLLKRLYRRKKL